MLTPVEPAGWPAPRGYSNGMMGQGRVLLVGGMVGWDTARSFPSGKPRSTPSQLSTGAMPPALLALVIAGRGKR